MENRNTLEVNKLTYKEFFLDKVMLISYVFLALFFFGVVEMVYERYFLLSATAADAGLFPGSRAVAEAMKEAVFGNGGEVKREAPWSLYIVNYIYMVYVGSGIIFIVAIGELLENKEIKNMAAAFLSLGLAMVIAGLVTILVDLNVLNLLSMLLSPQFSSGMWLMLPLYTVYVPLVILEIYLVLSHKDAWIKKIAYAIIILSLLVEVIEFYVQAKLFDMNSARHLWTTYPLLPLYFVVSSFTSSLAIMSLYVYLNKGNFMLRYIIERATLYFVLALGIYEAVSYLFIDKKWAEIILFGDFKYWFYLYVFLAVLLPLALLFKHYMNIYFKITAAFSIILGTFLGKIVFVYGGNAYPMSDRFGVGFEKYFEYDEVKNVIFFMPPFSEVAIVIGSVGIVLIIFRAVDLLLLPKKLVEKGV
ncbi:polysulfide reductase NrfD [Sulfurimonas sp. SAG-AH-194-I05]|nr:NrfD/PsrC family molybdoenzyme membrane anchor subunit [Sulfurimonas sp. SAG-AH-194-I05]MDF1874356.1 polysulfide reductase NrfD [Sulfurimonas sp. SAG-AH-194-I05]